jgi:hypothetical protein
LPLNRDPDEPDEVPWSELSPLRRLVHVVVTVAYLVMTVWFAWSLVGEDSIPPAVDIASAVAAVIVVAAAGSRLLRGRPRSS